MSNKKGATCPVNMISEERARIRLVVTAYRRRALIASGLAVASLALLIGVLLGFYLRADRNVAIASDRVLPPEVTSAFVNIARQVEPSVVHISTVVQPTREAAETSPDGLAPERVRRGIGSGVIVDPEGFVLTNHHVVSGVYRIKVRLFDGLEYAARVVGSDRDSDLALLKFEPQIQLKAARIGDSDRIQVGDWVLAIGSPFGLDQTVTAGIISAKDREANELSNRPSAQHFLQTDAAINRGNSGGPLINLVGEVIAINSAIATTTGDYNGICFALPSNEALAIYRQLKPGGRVVRGFLGVGTDPVTPQIANVFGLRSARGAIVSVISETYEDNGRQVPTPAVRAGFRIADIITEFRGEPIRHSQDLVRRVAATPVGAEVPIKVYRDGRDLTLRAVIGRRASGGSEPEPVTASRQIAADPPRTLGVDVTSPSPSAQRALSIAGIDGVVVSRVDPGSVADDADVRRDDVIERVNRIDVITAQQFKRAIDRIQSGDAIVLQVYRRRSPLPRRFISITKP
jgi:serine protease Do